FTEDMNAASITTATFELRDGANQIVPATVSYHASSRKATLNPISSLTNSNVYTARVVGGASGVKDLQAMHLLPTIVGVFQPRILFFNPLLSRLLRLSLISRLK